MKPRKPIPVNGRPIETNERHRCQEQVTTRALNNAAGKRDPEVDVAALSYARVRRWSDGSTAIASAWCHGN